MIVIKIEYFEILQLFFQLYILHIDYLLPKYVFFNIFRDYYNNISAHSQAILLTEFYSWIFLSAQYFCHFFSIFL